MTTLAVGPINTASQAVAWSDAARARGLAAFAFRFNDLGASLRHSSGTRDGGTTPIPDYRFAPVWYRRTLAHRLMRRRNVTHLLNESNVPVFSNPHRTRFVDEVAQWSEWGVTTGVLFHGSDVRDPDLSMELSEHSFFHDAPPDWVDTLRQRSALNRRSVEGASMPLYVTTPDLLAHVPGATLLPLTVDVDRWRTDVEVFERRVPRVLHRPSGHNSPTKGTSYISPVLDALERSGRITVIRSGVVPRHQMARMIADTDIVVDQLQTGAYGLTAIEGMAAGRLVIADVSTQARELLGDLPIVNANPATFAQVMDGVLCSLDESRKTAAAGPEFVRRWHNGRKASEVLTAFAK